MNKLTESVRDEASKIIATKRSAWVISSAILAILILLILPDVALGLVPAITISKTPPTQTVVSGGTATFTIRVDNTGDAALTNVTVSDPLAPDCNRIFASIAVGDFVEYTCTRTNVTAGFTNTATADSNETGPQIATAVVTVESPSIVVSKTPPTQTVVSSGTAIFTITADNTGDVDLTNVMVDDPHCDTLTPPVGDDGDGVLETTETWRYTCIVYNVTGDFTNTASVTAKPPTGPRVSGSDTADVIVAAPVIAIVKTTNGQDADTPPGPYIQAGEPVTWRYELRNNGNVTLTDVHVADSDLGSVTCDEGLTIPDLVPGGTFVCTTSGVATAGQYANTGTVTAKDLYNHNATDSDDSHYFGIRARLALEKTADVAAALVGDKITYNYVVTNIGNVSLGSIALTDDKLGSISLGTTTLAPGISTSGVAEYTVVSSDLPGPLQNTAQVTGEWVMSSTVTATANALESVTVSPIYYSYLPIVSIQSCLGAGDIGFESGDFRGWEVGGQLGHAITTEAHCGNWAALLGNPDYSCTGVPVGSAWMRASFPVPNTGSPTLTFWYRTLTYDANPNLTNKFDSFDVLVAGSLGFRYANQIDVLSCSTRRDSGWRQKTIDLSAYQGQNVTIEFQNYNRHDSFYNTWTYIDDITLEP